MRKDLTKEALMELIDKGMSINQMRLRLDVSSSTVKKYAKLLLDDDYQKKLKSNGKQSMLYAKMIWNRPVSEISQPKPPRLLTV